MKRAKAVATLTLFTLAIGLFACGIAAAEAVKLLFQYRADGVRMDTVNAWIEEFEAMHPDIDIEHYPPPSGYQERTLVAWAAGTGPDVTEIWGDWARDYARAGALLDLRRYVERDFTDEDVRDFWPVAWEASSLRTGDNPGAQTRIPRYMITLVYHYNQDHIDAAGLVNPMELDQRGEWTYPTLRDMARKLTLFNGNDVTRWGFTTDTDAYRRLAVWARAFGGDFFRSEDPTNFLGDEPEAVSAMTFLEEMIWQDRSTRPEFAPNDFYTGGVSLVEEGNHATLARFETTIAGSFNWNIAPTPVGPSGHRASYSGDDGFAIWRDTQHPDEAWEFVKFLTSTRGQEIAARIEGLAPVRRSAMEAYQTLAPHLNLHVHMINMLDASDPISSFMVGDVTQIGAQIQQVLEAAFERNEASYARGIEAVAPVIEALARQ